MFFGGRGRSRARAGTLITLVALVSSVFMTGVAPVRGSVALGATPAVDSPALRSDAPNGKGRKGRDLPSDKLSAMGLAAQRAQAAVAHGQGKKFQSIDKDFCTDQDDECEDTFDPDTTTPIIGGQAETSVAVDSTGMHVVVGFNDTRGFALNPISVSGYMYSDDGGATFTDGGLLPITVAQTFIGATKYPQAFGDPEVKYLGGSTFIYVEIMVRTISATGTAQTMGFHRSTDFGHTWKGPFEIPSATNPHGLLSGANARDAADKEFASVDPETGRVIMSWSNFTSTAFAPGGVEISTTYSDNVLTATPPTWSPRVIVGNTAADGQSSLPRFVGNGSPNAYVAWRRFPGSNNQNVGFARSSDNGATFSAPINLTSDFFTADQILGNDRINTSPSLAVDNSGGSRQGNVYVVYENNNNRDGGDIAFQRSTDGGISWSSPVLVNSRPGADRSQWFPWVTVDSATGRVGVFYYDQGIATSGDLTEVTYTFSDDGGVSWSRPAPISDRPFQAGWGNDTGQPNIGDYNQAVAQNGDLFAVFAATESKGFANGQPTSASFTTPDVVFKRVGAAAQAAVRLGPVTFTESGGNGRIDAGETVSLALPLQSYDTNPLSAGATTAIGATVSTATPNVTVIQASSGYPSLAAGATASNTTAYVIQTGAGFVLGTPIELVLGVSTAQGPTTLRYKLTTGTPSPTTIFSENFNGVLPGALPAGWVTSHAGGANTVPWTTSSTFCASTSNGAFHQNANDNGTGSPTRFERLFSPQFTVPASAQYVTLDFDVCYDTEDDPSFNILGYDGFTLRVTDQTTGRILRSNLIEAFAEDFTTGSSSHFPKHLPRSSNAAYFQDMSVWGGFSNGLKHVSMRLPGMAGSTAQLRWEFTQDSSATCADVRAGHACGVFVDNIVINAVSSVPGTAVAFTAPPDGTLTNQTSIAVAGTDANATSVTVNGVAATLGVGTWSATVPLPTEGANLITATAAGPTGPATASITVRRDTIPPLVTAPSGQIAEATSPAGALVTYSPCTATDLDPVTITYDIASGSLFALGATTVTCTATDSAGNAATAHFTVTVRDTTPPVVAAPPGETAEATGPGGAFVTYLACTATDAVSSVTITYSQRSGTQFGLGVTEVICTGTDAAGNSSAASIFINVVDTTAPSITGSTTPVSPNPNGWFNTDVAIHFTCSDFFLASCSPNVTVGEGISDTTGTAVDTSGNTATAHVIAKVDKTLPVITFAGDHAYLVSDTVLVTCTATDALSGIATTSCPAVVNAPAASFTLGTHTVSATATDRAGNIRTATTTFSVGVTYASLCTLTQSLSTKTGVADSLCAKLTNASAAAARGNTKAAGNILDAYQNELRAQSGKAFSAADAALLSGLADALR